MSRASLTEKLEAQQDGAIGTPGRLHEVADGRLVLSIPLPSTEVRGAVEALVLYAATVLSLSVGIINDLGDRILGAGVSDNFYDVWFLWWFKHAIESGQDPGHTHLVYALLPSVQVFVQFWYADLIGLVLQQVTGPLQAYNLLVLLSFVVSGFTMYLLAGEFVKSWSARFSAGFLYTFSTYHFFRAEAHVGLMTIEWLPFFAWRLFVFYRKPTIGNAILAGIALALVPLSDIHYLPYFAIPFVLLFAGWKLKADRPWFCQFRHLQLAGLMALVTALIAVPLLIGYLILDPDIRGAMVAISDDGTVRYSADLLSFFLPNPGNPFVGSHTSSIYAHMRSDQYIEEAVFLGPALLLAAIALFSRRNRQRGAIFWLVVGGCGLILALGPELQVAGHTIISLPFYRLAFGWGPLSSFRAPNRLAVLPIVASCVLSAYAIDDIQTRLGSRLLLGAFAWIVAAVLALSLALATVSSVSFPTLAVGTPPAYQSIVQDHTDNLVLELPVTQFSPQYQYFQTIHHHPLVNGYVSRFTPRMIQSTNEIPYLDRLQPGGVKARGTRARTAFLQGLRKHRVRYVLLNNWIYAGMEYNQAQAFLTHTLGPPFLRDPVTWQLAWRVPGV